MPDSTSEERASDGRHDTQPEQRAEVAGDATREFSDSDRRELAATLKGILPEDATADAVAAIALEIVREQRSYQGPMPSGKMLAELGEVDSSFPDRAMQYAEREQAFRHEIIRARAAQERSIPFYDFLSRSLGQTCTLLIVIVIVASVAYLSYLDKNVSAFTPLIYAVTGLAAVLVATKTAPDIIRSIRQAMDKKRGDLQGDVEAESPS
jgi:uncharacterized membrane protein